jgi:hypothetical protein
LTRLRLTKPNLSKLWRILTVIQICITRLLTRNKVPGSAMRLLLTFKTVQIQILSFPHFLFKLTPSWDCHFICETFQYVGTQDSLKSMEQPKRVTILPNGQANGGTCIVIQEDDDFDSFIERTSKKLWKGKKIGRRLFFHNGAEVLDDLADIINGDTLYITDGEDWIGILLFRCFC